MLLKSPTGTAEYSPVLQCWVHMARKNTQCPKGTTENPFLPAAHLPSAGHRLAPRDGESKSPTGTTEYSPRWGRVLNGTCAGSINAHSNRISLCSNTCLSLGLPLTWQNSLSSLAGLQAGACPEWDLRKQRRVTFTKRTSFLPPALAGG